MNLPDYEVISASGNPPMRRTTLRQIIIKTTFQFTIFDGKIVDTFVWFIARIHGFYPDNVLPFPVLAFEAQNA